MHFFRGLAVLPALFLGVSAALGQSCTNLCLQQVSCPNGGSTTISGTVYTPNGTDPLPNVLVYIPNAPVSVFAPGVECEAAGTPPSGSPLVGTTTAVDGTFTLTNVPVGTNIPLVIQSGRWRRQLTVATTTACANTAFNASMPTNQSEGDIPKIAIVTGKEDQVECVLRKVGVQDSEFTNPTGTGRINLYLGDTGPGAQIDATTPAEATLMGTLTTLNQYDVVMLPCQGAPAAKTAPELSNFVSFSNEGGRVYSSHYSYDYIDGNPNQAAVANWTPREAMPPDGLATVNTTFAEGETLAEWLQLVGATTTEGQMQINTLRVDMNGVIAPTQSWLALNDSTLNNPVMQFVYNAPVGATNQCGRVLFNEYHVEDPGASSPRGVAFPQECPATAMTPQEKLLEFSLFELTNDGGEPTISPTAADFGSEPVGFATAAKTFTWTNNSTFPASATAAVGTADYVVTSNNCQSVAGNSSCSISVEFKPTALGTRADTLTVMSTGPSLMASLTGVGTPDLSVSPGGLSFGNDDVGKSVTQTLTVTNPNNGAVAVAGITTTGDYAATSNCGSTVAASSTCSITITFTPTATGTRAGTVTVGGNPAVMLTGNGVDFTFALSPDSGNVEAGLSVMTTGTTTPLAGFANAVTLSCTTNAPATTCGMDSSAFTPNAAVATTVTITTTSKYTIPGYSGYGGQGWMWLAGAGSGLMLLLRRRRVGRLARTGLMVVVLGAVGMSVTGCSSKYPALNPVYTPPGNYTVTVSGTDGFLVHTATYMMNVSAE